MTGDEAMNVLYFSCLCRRGLYQNQQLPPTFFIPFVLLLCCIYNVVCQKKDYTPSQSLYTRMGRMSTEKEKVTGSEQKSRGRHAIKSPTWMAASIGGYKVATRLDM